jgi:hypothetical protein
MTSETQSHEVSADVGRQHGAFLGFFSRLFVMIGLDYFYSTEPLLAPHSDKGIREILVHMFRKSAADRHDSGLTAQTGRRRPL